MSGLSGVSEATISTGIAKAKGTSHNQLLTLLNQGCPFWVCMEHVSLDVLVPDSPHMAFGATLMIGFDFGMHRKVSPGTTACQLQELRVLNDGLIQGFCQDQVGAFFVDGTQK